MSFVKDAQDQIATLKEKFDLQGLGNLVSQLPSLIDTVTKDLEGSRKEKNGARRSTALLKSEL